MLVAVSVTVPLDGEAAEPLGMTNVMALASIAASRTVALRIVRVEMVCLDNNVHLV